MDALRRVRLHHMDIRHPTADMRHAACDDLPAEAVATSATHFVTFVFFVAENESRYRRAEGSGSGRDALCRVRQPHGHSTPDSRYATCDDLRAEVIGCDDLRPSHFATFVFFVAETES